MRFLCVTIGVQRQILSGDVFKKSRYLHSHVRTGFSNKSLWKPRNAIMIAKQKRNCEHHTIQLKQQDATQETVSGTIVRAVDCDTRDLRFKSNETQFR